MGFIAQHAITHIVIMRHLNLVKQNNVFKLGRITNYSTLANMYAGGQNAVLNNAFNEAAQFVTGTADADAAVSLIVDGMTAANATVSNGQLHFLRYGIRARSRYESVRCKRNGKSRI